MEEVDLVIERIRRYVGGTRYSCSIGYCYSDKESKSIKEMVKVSDEMMYADKAHYYETTGDRRRSN
jgi:predicted HD phosphohydrolase